MRHDRSASWRNVWSVHPRILFALFRFGDHIDCSLREWICEAALQHFAFQRKASHVPSFHNILSIFKMGWELFERKPTLTSRACHRVSKKQSSSKSSNVALSLISNLMIVLYSEPWWTRFKQRARKSTYRAIPTHMMVRTLNVAIFFYKWGFFKLF